MILIKKGDLVISGINVEKGAMAIYNGDDDILATIHYSSYIINKNKIDLEFLEIYLKSQNFINTLKEQVPGGIKTEIKPKHILTLVIEIPESVEEQKLFTAKFQQIKTTQNSLQNELISQQHLIKKLKQAYLTEALNGTLPIPANSPAQATTESPSTQSEAPLSFKPAPNKHLKPITPSEIPFQIPKNWKWCRLGQVVELARGKSKHRPRNDISLFINGIIPFIQTGDVARSKNTNYLIDSIHSYYNEHGLKQSCLFEKGTLCITIAANIAECGFLNFRACVPDSIVIVKPNNNVNIKLIFYYLLISKSEIQKFAPATAQKNINLEILNELIFPLPPLQQQQQIVARLDQLMAVCDSLETENKTNLARCNELLQANLQESLEGGTN